MSGQADCPRCQSKQVIPILHGKLDADQEGLISQEQAMRGQEARTEDDPDWFCQECGREWIEGEF